MHGISGRFDRLPPTNPNNPALPATLPQPLAKKQSKLIKRQQLSACFQPVIRHRTSKKVNFSEQAPGSKRNDLEVFYLSC
jgi:hypothetical protein